MAASVTSSIDLLEHPVRAVAPANEGQCTPGLVVQPVALGARCNIEGSVQRDPKQEQGMGEVGRHPVCAPTCAWQSVLLTYRNALIMVVVYLAVASINDLAPVVSRVICWASSWNRHVLSTVIMASLVWT